MIWRFMGRSHGENIRSIESFVLGLSIKDAIRYESITEIRNLMNS